MKSNEIISFDDDQELQLASILRIYCERTQFGLWAEPLNLLTNLAFMIAALAVGRIFLRRPTTLIADWDLALLIGCLFGIGAGSALWHSYAMPWAMLADVIPIIVFINLFFLSFLVRIGGCNVWQTVLFFLAFQIVNYIFAALFDRETLNGSIMYLPTYTALLACTGYLFRKHHLAARPFLVASISFTVSLVFRTVDNHLCDTFPAGTHFLWHLLNGFVLYTLLVAIMKPDDRNNYRPSKTY